MRCPICAKEGREHRLTEQRIATPLVANMVRSFWDEQDRKHIHDGEKRMFVYSCSNDHHFRVDAVSRCPVRDCDWNDKPEVKAGQKTLEEIHAEKS